MDWSKLQPVIKPVDAGRLARTCERVAKVLGRTEACEYSIDWGIHADLGSAAGCVLVTACKELEKGSRKPLDGWMGGGFTEADIQDPVAISSESAGHLKDLLGDLGIATSGPWAKKSDPNYAQAEEAVLAARGQLAFERDCKAGGPRTGLKFWADPSMGQDQVRNPVLIGKRTADGLGELLDAFGVAWRGIKWADPSTDPNDAQPVTLEALEQLRKERAKAAKGRMELQQAKIRIEELETEVSRLRACARPQYVEELSQMGPAVKGEIRSLRELAGLKAESGHLTAGMAIWEANEVLRVQRNTVPEHRLTLEKFTFDANGAQQMKRLAETVGVPLTDANGAEPVNHLGYIAMCVRHKLEALKSQKPVCPHQDWTQEGGVGDRTISFASAEVLKDVIKLLGESPQVMNLQECLLTPVRRLIEKANGATVQELPSWELEAPFVGRRSIDSFSASILRKLIVGFNRVPRDGGLDACLGVPVRELQQQLAEKQANLDKLAASLKSLGLA